MTAALRILSGGAANGLVNALKGPFERAFGVEIAGTFGAVGAMKAKLLAGEPADLLILSPPLIAELIAAGAAVPGSANPIGIVRTAIAVKTGSAKADVADEAGLKAALLAADAIYFPDPELATAGIHFAKVLQQLGIADEVASRLKPFPNGQTAMAAMAAASDRRPIGCTQVTEILNTPGVSLVASLPKAFELATVYTSAIAASAVHPDIARRFAAVLSSTDAAAARAKAGFEDR